MSKKERKMEKRNGTQKKVTRKAKQNCYSHTVIYTFFTFYLRCKSTLDRLDIYIFDS